MTMRIADRCSGESAAAPLSLGLSCADAVVTPSAKTAAAVAEPKIDFFMGAPPGLRYLPDPHASVPLSAFHREGFVLIVQLGAGTTRRRIGVARIECQCTDPCTRDQGCAFVTGPPTGW
jgi:hypothetical protein